MDGFPNLDLRSNEKGVIDVGLNPKEIKNIEENAVTQSLEVIRNRIDQFGVTEPVIVRQGEDEIVLQLPGVKDPERAIELVGRTAQLEFKLVDATALQSARPDGRIHTVRRLSPSTIRNSIRP
jgi:SecD/SecF fusion protein